MTAIESLGKLSALAPNVYLWSSALHMGCGGLTGEMMSGAAAHHDASLAVAYQLYLPKERAKDRTRRRKTGVPKNIKFKTKPQIALEQSRQKALENRAGDARVRHYNSFKMLTINGGYGKANATQ